MGNSGFKASVRKRFPILPLTLLACLLLNDGCQLFGVKESQESVYLPGVKKVVVVGFVAALSGPGPAELVRNPLSGNSFMAEPVPRDVVQEMTNLLFEKLLEEKRYQLITPGQAIGVFSSIVSSDQNLGMDPIKVLERVGKAFSADAVLVGYIYRWENRLGTDYAVDRPASVAFDLYLVRPADGLILWKATFDKTQRSLTENLYDLSTFVKGGGRWMTADKLGRVGLQELLSKMPADKPGESSREKPTQEDKL